VAGFTVVYDACVLYPAPLRDFLMQLATSGLFRACWTETILDEWMTRVMSARPDLSQSRLERTRQLMNAATLDSLVTDYEHLISVVELPDDDDRHVVAAAIKCGAASIVTFNLRDFPARCLESHNLEALDPDEFTVQQFYLSQSKVIDSARRHRARLRQPPKNVEEYLVTLEKQGLPRAVALLRKYRNLI
jgi:predicted nucleic acid-binding protein